LEVESKKPHSQATPPHKFLKRRLPDNGSPSWLQQNGVLIHSPVNSLRSRANVAATSA
jgi:hypothetical protein